MIYGLGSLCFYPFLIYYWRLEWKSNSEILSHFHCKGWWRWYNIRRQVSFIDKRRVIGEINRDMYSIDIPRIKKGNTIRVNLICIIYVKDFIRNFHKGPSPFRLTIWDWDEGRRFERKERYQFPFELTIRRPTVTPDLETSPGIPSSSTPTTPQKRWLSNPSRTWGVFCSWTSVGVWDSYCLNTWSDSEGLRISRSYLDSS